MGVELSCFLGEGLFGAVGGFVGDSVGVLFGDLVGGGVGVLLWEVIGVFRGVFVGFDLSGFLHEGWSMMSSMVRVGRLEGAFTVSGLSLVLFSVLPLGGLTPRLGRVVMLSIFGIVYGPKTVGSTLMYSLSPRVLIHSSMLL